MSGTVLDHEGTLLSHVRANKQVEHVMKVTDDTYQQSNNKFSILTKKH